MKPDWHLKLPGGSMVWRETAQERLKRLTPSKHVHLRTPPGALAYFLLHRPFFPLYQKAKEQETKEEGSERRRWVKIASLLWLPSCAFQVLWPHPSTSPPPRPPHSRIPFFFFSRTKNSNSLPAFRIQGKKNESFPPSCRMLAGDKLHRAESHLVVGAI